MLDISLENLLLFASLFINLLVIGVLTLHILKDGKIKEGQAAASIDEESLKGLVTHMEDLVMECERVSRNLCDRLASKEQGCEDLLRRMDRKKDAIIAQYVSQLRRGPLDDADLPVDAEIKDHEINQVVTLADTGLTPSEISRRLDIPVGEVKLMLSLQRQ